MLEKVKEYYKMEYEEVESLLKGEDRPFWAEPNQVIDKSIQRCLGVAQFIQTVGVDFKDLDCYDEVREKLENLRKEVLTNKTK